MFIGPDCLGIVTTIDKTETVVRIDLKGQAVLFVLTSSSSHSIFTRVKKRKKKKKLRAHSSIWANACMDTSNNINKNKTKNKTKKKNKQTNRTKTNKE